MNQCPVKRQWPRLLSHIENGHLKPSEALGPQAQVQPGHRGALGVPRASTREVAARAIHRAQISSSGIRHVDATQRHLGRHATFRLPIQRGPGGALAHPAGSRSGGRGRKPHPVAVHPASGQPNHRDRITAELSHHGLSSRVHHKRVDLAHQWIDPILVAGPWALTAVAGYPRGEGACGGAAPSKGGTPGQLGLSSTATSRRSYDKPRSAVRI
jgi:hypothetical protein